MLSKVIKNMVEQRFGHQIRYPRDADALALHISTVCKTGLSGSTLKRLFGFTKRKGNEQPRLYTLDIISTYLGRKGWEELAGQLIKGSVDVNFVTMEELLPAKLKKGEIIQMGYEPGKEITLQYTGKGQFTVSDSNDGRLSVTDMVKFQKAVLHYPLLINEVTHAGDSTGQYVVGRISGITYIKKIRDEKQPAKK